MKIAVDASTPGIDSRDGAEFGAGGYLNAIVPFEDGSRWKCTKALSPPKYQQGQPPFEATGVYECICVKDPSSAQREGQEAVIKAKYQ